MQGTFVLPCFARDWFHGNQPLRWTLDSDPVFFKRKDGVCPILLGAKESIWP